MLDVSCSKLVSELHVAADLGKDNEMVGESSVWGRLSHHKKCMELHHVKFAGMVGFDPARAHTVARFMVSSPS